MLAVPLAGALSIAAAVYLYFYVKGKDSGTDRMKEVAAAIKEGSDAYLKREYKTLAVFVAIMAVIISFLLNNYLVGVAYVLGSFCSAAAGYFGMEVALKANVKSANAARTSLNKAFPIAFYGGAVMGMSIVGIALIGVSLLYYVFGDLNVVLGFSFGASAMALFAKAGGGIYTKTADIAADLVGKVEKNIPEDDPRNAATIADNVGDNVGDCAGMAADVFESYEVTLVAAIILAAACTVDPVFLAMYGAGAPHFALKLVIFALLVRAVGVIASILGVWAVRPNEKKFSDPMKCINMGYAVAAMASVIGIWLVNKYYLIDPVRGAPDYRYTIAGAMGLVLAVATLWLTNYFTHPGYKPVKETTKLTATGAAPMLIRGLAEGMESSVWAILIIAATIFTSVLLFPESLALASFAIAVSGLGLLSTTGYVLAMDTYGPITDNAHGIFEMSGVKNKVASKSLAWMDAIGNTTKALTKGLAIATAVIAAISLFRSFIDEAGLARIGIQINLPEVFVGLLIGGAVPFLFSAFALKAVGRAAACVVHEVRDQFRKFPGIMKGTQRPQYAKVVEIVTKEAQKELLGPGLLALGAPIFVAFMLGPSALGGYLCGAILTGQLLAVFMSNTGGLWDNAKKTIEDGAMGGKGSDAHKASVIGDTVGDPFKDTAGPALNPLIKVMNLVALLIVPVVVFGPAVAPKETAAIVMKQSAVVGEMAAPVEGRKPISPLVRYTIAGLGALAVVVAVMISHKDVVEKKRRRR